MLLILVTQLRVQPILQNFKHPLFLTPGVETSIHNMTKGQVDHINNQWEAQFGRGWGPDVKHWPEHPEFEKNLNKGPLMAKNFPSFS